MTMDKLFEVDLYQLMGVNPLSSIQEIKRAYRKKALLCHPDKHPNDPRGAETFQELSKALEILTDVSARTAYDKLLLAKQQTKARLREFDAKRKKLKTDLEAREEAYRKTLSTDYEAKTEKQKFQAEIERLEKEGSKLVEEEVAFIQKKIQEGLHESTNQSELNSKIGPLHRRVKIKWKIHGNDPENGGYNYDNLHRILMKYGDITVLVISSTKRGRAMVEFNSENAAETAVLVESGFAENPLILQGLWGTKGKSLCTKDVFRKKDCENKIFPAYKSSDKRTNDKPSGPLSFSAAPDIFKTMPDAEFENTVLNNLKKAEERKRLSELSELSEPRDKSEESRKFH